MSKNQTLQNYLLNNGKTHSWQEIGNMFNVSADAARHTWRRIKKSNKSSDKTELNNYISELEDTIVSLVEDISKGTAEKTFNSNESIKTLEDLIRVGRIDTNIWNIDKYVQNFWGDKFQVKAFLSKKSEQQNFTQEFTKFLSNYKPSRKQHNIDKSVKKNNSSCIVINKQDLHYNKLDVNGNNDIDKRFGEVRTLVENTVNKATTTSNIDKIYYIVGSDEFNSEWTNMTTKGTPQANILSYHEAFKTICNFEINIIESLLDTNAEIEVIYIPGNHDEFVGWHLINFLECEFQDSNQISFDSSTDYTKYRRYGNSALMFNHGDAIKPEKLAQIFPIEFSTEWGKCENFYIYIGDRHHNHYKDLNGIEFYQLPAMSKSSSNWDKKNGYTSSKNKMITFVISEKDGITDIYHHKM